MLKFIYNIQKSPSTKKGIRQISLAFGLSLLLILSLPVAEAGFKFIFKLDKSNKKENNEIEQTKTDQKTLNKNNQCEYISLICIIRDIMTDSKLLGQLQNFAVLAAACLYFFEVVDRKKQMERQAWQLIDGAQGSETSGARYQAIEELYEEDKNSLKGLDADGADLIGINLQKANLVRANFKGADLRMANLQGAILTSAQLQGANLQGVDLSRANLLGANLQGAKLDNIDVDDIEELGIDLEKKLREQEKERVPLWQIGLFLWAIESQAYSLMRYIASEMECSQEKGTTKLRGAILTGAILNEANLNHADLKGAKLNGAFLRDTHLAMTILKNANIFGVKFRGAVGLDIGQVRKAHNWKNAKYDKEFCSKYQHYALKEDEIGHEVESLNNETSEIRKKITILIQETESGKSVEQKLYKEFLETMLVFLDRVERDPYGFQECSPSKLAELNIKKTNLINKFSKFKSEIEEVYQSIKNDEDELKRAEEILIEDEIQFMKAKQMLSQDEAKNS